MKKPEKQPFVVTHRRKKDGLEGMLLARTTDKRVLMRVRYQEGGRPQDNTTVTSEAGFAERFEVVV
jgi:hypothetical protein